MSRQEVTVSSMQTQRFEFRWEIQDFDKRFNSDPKCDELRKISSNSFEAKDVPNIDARGRRHSSLTLTFHLDLVYETGGHCYGGVFYFSTKMCPGKPDCPSKITFRLRDADNDGNSESVYPHPNEFSMFDENKRNLQQVFKYSRWIRTCKRMLVIVEVEFARNVTEKVYRNDFSVPGSGGPTLSDELKKLFHSGDFADFEIVCRGRTFPAYKMILAARSDVFRTLLGHKDFVENKSNSVKIDVIPEVMEQFLGYLLNDIVDGRLLGTFADELYKLAHEYNVQGLLAVCRDYIAPRINIYNCVDNIRFGGHYEDEVILAAAKEVLKANAKNVVVTSAWMELKEEEPRLVAELLTKMVG